MTDDLVCALRLRRLPDRVDTRMGEQATMTGTRKIMLVWEPGAGHDRCIVFVGPDRDHLASCGALTFKHDEAAAFRLVVRTGIAPRTGIDGIFERGWTYADD